MIECEIKLKIENKEIIKSRLMSQGFSERCSLTEIDTYYDNKNGDVRSNDNALRIRETINHTTGDKYCQVNFKGKKLDANTVSRPEYETLVNDPQAMTGLLNGLGFYSVKPIVKKLRLEMQASDINACLDSVEGLGDYLELETIVATESEKEKALEKISAILEKLGYCINDTTTISYLSALQEKN